MNALLSAIRKRIQWRFLAVIDRPFTDDHYPPTKQEVNQRLQNLNYGELLLVLAIVKILSWLDKIGGKHDRPQNK